MPQEKTTKEKLLEEFIQLRIKIPYQNFNLSPSDFYKLENGFIVLQDFFLKAIDQTREEAIRGEIEYWKGVFDKRPKDRDLESDNIAQNFARIEIERLENKIKSLINKQ